MYLVSAFLIGALVIGVLVFVRTRYLSFIAQSPDEYEGLAPEIDIRRHLDGPILCEGVIFGPFGRVSSRFTATMRGEWNGNTGILHERFLFDKGDTQDRAWHLTLLDDGGIRATAQDVPGEGRGRQSGPVVCLKYRIRLPVESGGYTLDAVDWMYLVEDGKIINRSQFRKYGIKVAELVATIRREDSA